MFRYPANVTQKKYGICKYAANKSIFLNFIIIVIISHHSNSNHMNANKYAFILKNIILQKKFTTN